MSGRKWWDQCSVLHLWATTESHEFRSDVYSSERTLGNCNRFIKQVHDSKSAKSLVVRDLVVNLQRTLFTYLHTAQNPDIKYTRIISNAYYIGHA